MTSIKHRSPDPGHPAAPKPATARLPDFCNLGIMLRLLVIVNLLCIAAAVVRADVRDLWQQFLYISAVAQPAIIFSLLVMCACRRPLAKLAYWQGITSLALLEAIIGFLFWWWLHTITPFAEPVSLWQYGFFVAFATGFALFYFDLRSRALSPALTEARLQALQARIRPHFLFNSINAVLSLIRSEPKRAERMLEDMSELFRVLMADNRKLTPLADEITLCKRYLEIEEIRLGERLLVDWKIAGMPADALVPPLILQPLVENAVYHGIEPLHLPGTLIIEVLPRGKQFSIRLTNPFHADSTHVSGNRMAIANIKERLQLHFDAEASLNAEVKGESYVVTITLPVRTQDL
ncbi:MAG: histidine kinase [Burkholderiales bacterium]|nr:histidine kinase [Burkholderiales bacterium]